VRERCTARPDVTRSHAKTLVNLARGASQAFLLMALRMTEGSRWHDNLDQPGRHIIDESGNKPVKRQGRDRFEGSHIDRHRRVRIGDRFGQEAFLADTKVARKPGQGPDRGE
jgi:hypothetical protein